MARRVDGRREHVYFDNDAVPQAPVDRVDRVRVDADEADAREDAGPQTIEARPRVRRPPASRAGRAGSRAAARRGAAAAPTRRLPRPRPGRRDMAPPPVRRAAGPDAACPRRGRFRRPSRRPRRPSRSAEPP